jgi:hypothetical protein
VVLLIAILSHGGALALILWQARRHSIQSRYQPSASSMAPLPLPVPRETGTS